MRNQFLRRNYLRTRRRNWKPRKRRRRNFIDSNKKHLKPRGRRKRLKE